MSVPVIAFFNNKGGVGKTSLVYHLAWMYTDHGVRVLAADLDPQANLTVAFLDEERLEELWGESAGRRTVYGALAPLKLGTGDILSPPHVEKVPAASPEILEPRLLVGDLALARFESDLAETWPKCMDSEPRAFRVTSAFWRLLQAAAEDSEAQVVLVDLGPNLGAINRTALISSDHVVVPLSPDLFSLQGLRNLGPTLGEWRLHWRNRLEANTDPDLSLPPGRARPAGYVVLQHAVRLDRPVRAYDQWIARIPEVYAREMLEHTEGFPANVGDDPHCLGLLKHYRSLMPMAQEANKPMFFLRSADGAIGAHQEAVRGVYGDFQALAGAIAARTGIPWSPAAV